MLEREKQTILTALDQLALALADYGHTWTNDQRESYEQATEALIADSGPHMGSVNRRAA